jgi:hypothetical protein
MIMAHLMHMSMQITLTLSPAAPRPPSFNGSRANSAYQRGPPLAEKNDSEHFTAAAEGRRCEQTATLITPIPPTYRGYCLQFHVQADRATAIRNRGRRWCHWNHNEKMH